MVEPVTPEPSGSVPDGLPAGGVELLSLLTRLLRRPRRGDHRLPVIWLVRAVAGSDPGALLRRFVGRGVGRRVPHAVLDLAVRRDISDVPALLRELHRQLSLEAFGAARLRFRHYPLADWLMQQTLGVGTGPAGPADSADPADPADSGRATLVRRLRDRRGRRPVDEPQVSGESGVGTALQVLLWLLRRAVPSVVFRIAVSGRVPVVGGQYRWFMRQQYLAPRQSVTFLGFAERLTAGWRDGEQPAQVDKLLLHAFLEDLRQAYRRRVWRPGDWRRTAYPVLLLDGVTVGSVGHTLARLLNDVRNETGRNDPLLVVALAAEPPPELPGTRPLREADDAVDEWAEAVTETRRLRRPAAWLVALRPDADDATPPPGWSRPRWSPPIRRGGRGGSYRRRWCWRCWSGPVHGRTAAGRPTAIRR